MTAYKVVILEDGKEYSLDDLIAANELEGYLSQYVKLADPLVVGLDTYTHRYTLDGVTSYIRVVELDGVDAETQYYDELNRGYNQDRI